MNNIFTLKTNDVIGLICPAGPCKSIEDINKFKLILEARGYQVIVGKSCYENIGYLAGDDYLRAKDLMDMFINDNINAIFCYKGGYGCQRLLPYLDFEIIKQHPKLFVGFSDITVLLNTFYQRCLFPTLHGPMGITLNKQQYNEQNDFFDIINKGFTKPLKNTLNKPQIINEGITSGILVGGNLSLIYALMGTPYEIDLKDKILFIEDVDEAPYAIDRMLSSLSLSGKLQGVKGIIVGTFTNIKEGEDKEIFNLINHYFKPLNVPTIYNFEAGHSHLNIPLPIGLNVTLNTLTLTIEVGSKLM